MILKHIYTVAVHDIPKQIIQHDKTLSNVRKVKFPYISVMHCHILMHVLSYLHNEGVVPMLIFDLVNTSPSCNTLLLPFWANTDDNPPPFQMAKNGNIFIDSQ